MSVAHHEVVGTAQEAAAAQTVIREDCPCLKPKASSLKQDWNITADLPSGLEIIQVRGSEAVLTGVKTSPGIGGNTRVENDRLL